MKEKATLGVSTFILHFKLKDFCIEIIDLIESLKIIKNSLRQ